MSELDRWTKMFNAFVGRLARAGISVTGARELETIGRKSGQPRTTPVNLMKVDGQPYLVAPRGQTDWVRNVRKNPEVKLRLGRRVETYTAVEVHGDAAVPVMRYYLKKWFWEVGAFFPEGVRAKSTDAEIAGIIPAHPVFKLQPSSPVE
ncbi:nitroreductase family deazaflavin-dependent oxidoreductase [Luteipulveratus mongoliensis]|uniref:Nitroreductase n=1 Tax=Luteipulveratus mongoliensis TaxID=571913 RepID=A0A0K1JRN8_9MICO|nr:nitroreductase family deazaflavin-dependent oxidoreductase [Luteipulveratus mongoliensis]AKU19243.1 hypothetical protein VV02_23570 [Luteipulveratus mongoliensis]